MNGFDPTQQLPTGPYSPSPLPLAAPPPPLNVSRFLQRYNPTPPGTAFKNALGAGQGVAQPKAAPNYSALNSSFDSASLGAQGMTAASDFKTKTEAAHQQALTDYYAFNPDTGAAPQYTPPADTQSPQEIGQSLGHMLGGLIAPRLAPAGARGIGFESQQHKEREATLQRNAELQQQAAEAEAARRQHLAEVQLAKKEALVTSTGNDYDRSVTAFEKSVDDVRRANNADTLTKAKIDNFASLINTRNIDSAIKQGTLAETIKRDQQNFQIKNAARAAQITETQWRIAASQISQGVKAKAALALASARTRAQFVLEKMKEDQSTLTATMKQNYSATVAQLNQYDKTIAAAQLPGASDEVVEAAKALTDKGGPMDQAMTKLQADSAGAVNAPRTDYEQQIEATYSEGWAQTPGAPNGTGGNVFAPSITVGGQGGPPQYAPMTSDPNAAGATATAALNNSPNADIYHKYGLTPPGGAAPGQQPHPATTGGAPPPAANPLAGEIAHVKQLIAAHPGDQPGQEKAAAIFAQRHNLSLPQAMQMLGLQMPKPPAPPSGVPPSGGASGAQAQHPAPPPQQPGVGLTGLHQQPPPGQPPTPPPAAPQTAPGAAQTPRPVQTPTARPQAAQGPQNVPPGVKNPEAYQAAQAAETYNKALQTAQGWAQWAEKQPNAKNVPPDQKIKTLAGLLQKKFPTLPPPAVQQIAAQVAGSQNPLGDMLSGAGHAAAAAPGQVLNAVNRWGPANSTLNHDPTGGSAAAGNPW